MLPTLEIIKTAFSDYSRIEKPQVRPGEGEKYCPRNLELGGFVSRLPLRAKAGVLVRIQLLVQRSCTVVVIENIWRNHQNSDTRTEKRVAGKILECFKT